MASPQKENGFVSIANDLHEALISQDIPAQPLRVFLAILRKTYGFNKKSDKLSHGQIAKMCNLPRRRVVWCMQWLKDHKMIIEYQPGGHGKGNAAVIGPQKDYDQWVFSATDDTKPDKKISAMGDTIYSATDDTIQSMNSAMGDTHKRHVLKDKKDSGAKKAPAKKKQTCPADWMTALYDVCAVDVALVSPSMRNRISAAGKALIGVGAALRDVERFKTRWYANDWRGQKGEPPTPEQIRDNWKKVLGTGTTKPNRAIFEEVRVAADTPAERKD